MKPIEIGVDIGVRIDQRIAHAGLRGEMHDVREAVLARTSAAMPARSARSSLTKRKSG